MEKIYENTLFAKVGYTYVPIQSFKEIYPPEEGLEVGTIFPELNLPISVYVPKTGGAPR